MRRLLFCLALLGWLAAALPSEAATGQIIKVLPEFLDLKGRVALSPSLYDRDAYQMQLRLHPNKRSGMRFFVQWKAKGTRGEPLMVRVELRGIAAGNLPRQLLLEQPVHVGGWFSHWASITLSGQTYKDFGEVTAWRTTLWQGDKLLGEQKSFLW